MTSSLSEKDGAVIVLPAVLGWSNPDTGPESLRLYATDQGGSPRWAKPHARVVETALRESPANTSEGDQYVVIRVGNRYTSGETIAACVVAVHNAVYGLRDDAQTGAL